MRGAWPLALLLLLLLGSGGAWVALSGDDEQDVEAEPRLLEARGERRPGLEARSAPEPEAPDAEAVPTPSEEARPKAVLRGTFLEDDRTRVPIGYVYVHPEDDEPASRWRVPVDFRGHWNAVREPGTWVVQLATPGGVLATRRATVVADEFWEWDFEISSALYIEGRIDPPADGKARSFDIQLFVGEELDLDNGLVANQYVTHDAPGYRLLLPKANAVYRLLVFEDRGTFPLVVSKPLRRIRKDVVLRIPVASASTASVKGTVRFDTPASDEEGNGSLTVLLIDAHGFEEHDHVGPDDGAWSILEVPPGRYTLRVENWDEDTLHEQQVTLEQDTAKELEITLRR